MAGKDVKIKMSAETRQAERDIVQLQRKVEKLGSVAEQGRTRQDGFLSPKQVAMFKNMVKEMEDSYAKHYKKLNAMEDDYYDKVVKAQEKIQRNQERLNRAEGGNKWGDVSSPGVREFYRHKVDEGKAELSGLGNLDANIEALSAAVGKMRRTIDSSEKYQNDIGQMHQMDNYTRRHMQGTMETVAGSSMLLGISKILNYTGQGMDLIRQERQSVSEVAMRTDYAGDDELARTDARALGLKNQYTVEQTAQLQSLLLSGGDQSIKTLSSDTEAIQSLARSTSIDANTLGTDATFLKRMGAVEEGQMRKFADLIGGAVTKGGMSGREEEMLRATTTLASSVSSELTKLSEKGLGNVMGLQSALGNAIPSLKGERGAQVIQSMDQAIKNGDSSFDVIMGKGSRYTGISGMYELQLLKEQGLSNPDTLKQFFTGANKHMGGNEKMVGFMAKEHLGLSLNEYEAMKESGLIDRIMAGDMPTAEEFKEAGATDLAKKAKMWEGSETRDTLDLNAQSKKIQGKWSKPWEELGTSIMQGVHALPDWAQMAGLGGMAVGGGMLIRGAGKVLFPGYKKGMPNIAKQAEMAKKGKQAISAKGLLQKGTKIGSKLLGPAGFLGSLSLGGDLINSGMDWLFGHDEGDYKKSGILTPTKMNEDGQIVPIFGEGEQYEKDKQGAISKAWDFVTPWDTKNEKSELKTAKDMSVKSLSIEEKDVGGLLRSRYSGSVDKKEVNVNVKLSGAIDNMSPENEEKVTQQILGNMLGLPVIPGLDLSIDMRRGGR